MTNTTIPALIPETEFRGRAWLAVGLLWAVGCLNYLDRVMITTMRGSLVEAIPMSDAQFGLLTTVFLWVYAACSPLAGHLADRLGRSVVIVASLLVWSVVTWATAHAKTYEQLLATRALMGVSEACYMPAALALISDYHRTTTRSLATGIHMTGTMVGGALGGLGGLLAEARDWSYAFKVFGAIGCGLAVALVFLLRDRRDGGAGGGGGETYPKTDALSNTAARGAARDGGARLADALKHLLGNKAFLLATCYWSLVAISSWAMVGWMPTFLQERFSLGQGRAGLSATVCLQAASLAGVLLGGAWADRWSRRNARGPMLVVMAGACIAVPSILATSLAGALWVALAGLACFGLAKAFADANMMPILTLVADRRHRATGYGILNFCACATGGLANLLGGVLRDAHADVALVFLAGALGYALAFFVMSRVRPAAKNQ